MQVSLTQNFTLYQIPEKIESDKGGSFIFNEQTKIFKSRNIEQEYCTPRIHTGMGAVERAIQTMLNLKANLVDNLCVIDGMW